MNSKRAFVARVAFYLALIVFASPSCSFSQVQVGMETSVLRPNYRSMILPGAPSPEIRVEVALDLGGLALDELEVIGKLKSNGDTVVQKSYSPPPSNPFNVDLDIPADMPAGDHLLSLDLYRDGDSDPLAQDTHELKKLSQEELSGLTSYIDGYKRFILNREPFFPLGLYVAQCSMNDQSAQLDDIADSPFDTVLNYAINRCGYPSNYIYPTEEDINDYLRQLTSRKLRLIFALNQYFGPCGNHNTMCENPLAVDEIVDVITQKVAAFRADPAIIGWYMNDEVCPACLAELQAGYDSILELDDGHIVWSVHYNKNWVLPEAHTTDIVGVDSYPVAHHPITKVAELADAAAQTGKPFWLVPQIFSWTDVPNDAAGRDESGRPPTKEEMRAMTYLAVNHGAKGLIYYSYFNILDDDDYETRWPQIKAIAGEIRDLRHVLLSTHQTNEDDIVCDNGNIDFKLMREGNTYYLFAVNTKEESFTGVSFQIDMALESDVVDVLFEEDGVGNRQIGVANGNIAHIADNFGPYEVHVYNWEGAADKDGDGFDSVEEWGPDGTDPNYDGDGDGKADSEHGNAASGHTHSGQHYVTIAVPDTASLSNCLVLDNPHPDNAPARRKFPFGSFGFEVMGLEAQGDCTAVTIELPQNGDISEYWRYGPTASHPGDHWYEFMYDGETGAEIFQEANGTRIVLHLCDAIRGDDDLDANGRIVDAGGPAVVIPSGGSGGGSCFISTMEASQLYGHIGRSCARSEDPSS